MKSRVAGLPLSLDTFAPSWERRSSRKLKPTLSRLMALDWCLSMSNTKSVHLKADRPVPAMLSLLLHRASPLVSPKTDPFTLPLTSTLGLPTSQPLTSTCVVPPRFWGLRVSASTVASTSLIDASQARPHHGSGKQGHGHT